MKRALPSSSVESVGPSTGNSCDQKVLVWDSALGSFPQRILPPLFSHSLDNSQALSNIMKKQCNVSFPYSALSPPLLSAASTRLMLIGVFSVLLEKARGL